MKIKPLFDFCLIEPLEEEERTPSGIVLPDSAKEKPQQGKVLAVGPGKQEDCDEEPIPIPVKVGNVVIYKKWGGNEVKVDGKELLLVKAEDILAVVT